MKIFFIYILILIVGIGGFVATVSFGLPKTETYDSLVAFSGMCIGALCSVLVIFFSNKKPNERV